MTHLCTDGRSTTQPVKNKREGGGYWQADTQADEGIVLRICRGRRYSPIFWSYRQITGAPVLIYSLSSHWVEKCKKSKIDWKIKCPRHIFGTYLKIAKIPLNEAFFLICYCYICLFFNSCILPMNWYFNQWGIFPDIILLWNYFTDFTKNYI